MAPSFPFTPLIETLPTTIPFTGPEAIERQQGTPFHVRIGANESAFGISPKARQAMVEAIDHISWYNDPENHDLREALAQHHTVSISNITVGGGIDDLLGLAVRAFLSPGQITVSSLGSYPTYHYHVNGFGAQSHTVPYHNDRNDLKALLDAVHKTGSHLVYFSNPDNPAGTYHTTTELQAFIDQLPETCIFILDEAYIEFAPKNAILPISPIHPRLIRMRTFSKAHGMAGARIGYAICDPEIVTAFEKIRLHFMVNRIAQAGALASLHDPDFVQSVVRSVAQGRQEYQALARSVGLNPLPSATNFVTFDAHTPERAGAILNALQSQGVFVRKPGAPPLDRCFRVTVGIPEERQAFAEILPDILAQIPEPK
jgi:histidinol-phosphate aminotransferase